MFASNSGFGEIFNRLEYSKNTLSGQYHRLPSAASETAPSHSLTRATQSLWIPKRVGVAFAMTLGLSHSQFHRETLDGTIRYASHFHREPSDLSATRRPLAVTAVQSFSLPT